MQHQFSNLACKNNHDQPITKVRLGKQLTQTDRFLCDLCNEQQPNEQILDITLVQQIINDFKKKQQESKELFLRFKSKQIYRVESNVSTLISSLIQILKELQKITENWKYYIESIDQQNCPSDFKLDVDNLIFNKWDDELKEYFVNIEEKNLNWIQKIQSKLNLFCNFQEIENCKLILQESIVLDDISPVRVKDNSISLALIYNSSFQNETCNAISINRTGKLIATCKEYNITIWDFVDGKMKSLTQLDRHKDYVSCLVFSKKVDSLISASYDKTIFCWKQLDKTKWICSQLHFQHTGPINCILLNQNENQLISGSSDQKIIIWDVDLNQNKLNYSYPLQLTAGDVEGLTMNKSETILVSCQNNKSIIIWSKGNDEKWKFQSTVIIKNMDYQVKKHILYNQKHQTIQNLSKNLDQELVF